MVGVQLGDACPGSTPSWNATTGVLKLLAAAGGLDDGTGKMTPRPSAPTRRLRIDSTDSCGVRRDGYMDRARAGAGLGWAWVGLDPTINQPFVELIKLIAWMLLDSCKFHGKVHWSITHNEYK